jgi:hypothetical protein
MVPKSEKPCDGPLCNVKKGTGEVDVTQLAEKKNRNTVYKIIFAIIIGVVTIVFVFYPPGGAPLIGEPINPASGTLAILAGVALQYWH